MELLVSRVRATIAKTVASMFLTRWSSSARVNLSTASLRRLTVNNADSTRVQNVTIVTEIWAPLTRSLSGTPTSPNCPMPNMVAQMTVLDQMNAAAIAKMGWQRAVSHNSSGNTGASASYVAQPPLG